MNPATPFPALVLRKSGAAVTAAVESLVVTDLPPGDVLVRVEAAGLNYKDAMAVGGRGIIRDFPAVPGIDAAGVVEESSDPRWKPGDRVILTGAGLGERFWGGLGAYLRVPADLPLALPPGLDSFAAMALGTAGLTAWHALARLEAVGLGPEAGEVLVSGASGGVGTWAVALLASRGYRVVAMSGKPEQEAALRGLGATRVVGRDFFGPTPADGRWTWGKALLAGAVDTVGGRTLASIVAHLDYGGAVAACGLAGGSEVDTHVLPFIVRQVSLLGVDSVRLSPSRKAALWETMARDPVVGRVMDPALGLVRRIGLEGLVAEAERMLAGGGRGRVVVSLP